MANMTYSDYFYEDFRKDNHRRLNDLKNRAQGIVGDRINLDEDLKSVEQELAAIQTSAGRADLTYITNNADDLKYENARRMFESRIDRVPDQYKKDYKDYVDLFGALSEQYAEDWKMNRRCDRISASIQPETSQNREDAKAVENGLKFMKDRLGESMQRVNDYREKMFLDLMYAWGDEDTRKTMPYARNVVGHRVDDIASWPDDKLSEMMDAIRNAPVVSPVQAAQAVMMLNEGVPGLHEPFLGGGRNLRVEDLTMQQRTFAVGNFDTAFNEIFPKDAVDSLNAEGKDILDQVYIDGVSANEKYGAAYAGSPYYSATEAIKCRMMADMMNGAHIQVAVPSPDAPDGCHIIPLAVQTDIQPVAERLNSHLQPIYPSLPPVTTETVRNVMVNLSIFADAAQQERMKGSLFRMGSQPDVLVTDEQLLGDCHNILEATLEGGDMEHPLYQQMGIRSKTDLIYIDGKSAREYLTKDGQAPTQAQVEAGILAAMMSGEHHVDMAQVGMDEQRHLTVHVSELKPDLHFLDGQERWYERTRAHKADRLYANTDGPESRHRIIEGSLANLPVVPEKTEEQIRQEIIDSQARLQQRSDLEKAKAEARTRQTQPMYSSLPPVETGSIRDIIMNFGIFADAVQQERVKDSLFQMGSQPDKLITDRQLLGECHSLLAAALGNLETDHPIYEQIGVRSKTDLIYIDGKPAREYFTKDGQVPNQAQVEAGIVAAMMSGEHHVDMAQIGMDEQGRFTVHASELKPNLHFLDGKERWYERTRAHKTDRLVADTDVMERRHRAIEGSLAERLVSKASRQLLTQENPYMTEQQRFLNKGTELTAAYFGENERAILEASIGGHAEMDRGTKGEYGGSLRLAQLVLMGEHPDVRYADLMNPHKFQKEKLEAGRKVAEALEDFRKWKEHPDEKPGFEKLTDVLATAVKAVGSIDIRKELLYAMGQPEDLPPDAMRRMLEEPDNSRTANGLLDSMARFGQSLSQAISGLERTQGNPRAKVQKLDKIDEHSFTPYLGLREKLSPDEITDYTKAIRGLEWGLKSENDWMKLVTGSGMTDSPGRIMGLSQAMADVRGWLVTDGAAKNMTGDFIFGVNALGKQADDYIQQHRNDFIKEGLIQTELMDIGNGKSKEVSVLDPGLRQHLIDGGGANIGKYMGFNNIKVEQGKGDWEKIQNSVQNELTAWTPHTPGTTLTELDLQSGCKTINRPTSFGSLALGRMMARGLSLDELLALSPEEKEKAAGDLRKFLEHRPMEGEHALTGDERDDALEDYADLYRLWGQKLLKEKLPDFNYTDPNQMKTAGGERLYLLGTLIQDYVQTGERYLRKQPKFAEGIPEELRDSELSMEVCSYLQVALKDCFSDKSAARLAGMDIMQTYGPKVAGREMSELSKFVHPVDIIARNQAAMTVLAQKTEEERQEYLLRGEIPADVKRAIERESKVQLEIIGPAYAEITKNSYAPAPQNAGNTMTGNTPAANTPVANTPAANTPVANAPAANTPVANAPAANTPVANAPAANTPVANAPAANTPVANAPAANTPTVRRATSYNNLNQELNPPKPNKMPGRARHNSVKVPDALTHTVPSKKS